MTRFNLSLLGGRGTDRITFRMGVQPTPFAQPIDCTLMMDGGDGGDVIDAEFTSDPTRQKVAELRVALVGGGGNDALRLLRTAGAAFDVNALADGGAGIDVGVFAPGVWHVNVERLR